VPSEPSYLDQVYASGFSNTTPSYYCRCGGQTINAHAGVFAAVDSGGVSLTWDRRPTEQVHRLCWWRRVTQTSPPLLRGHALVRSLYFFSFLSSRGTAPVPNCIAKRPMLKQVQRLQNEKLDIKKQSLNTDFPRTILLHCT
jgi:hypothetical protein